MNEILLQSAARMAAAVRNRQISSVELMDAHLAHVAEVNPKLNAIVEVAIEQARAGAAAADRRMASGEECGPLLGVPMTVKGAWDCTGMVNTGGTLGRKGMVAGSDATVVARLKEAGAIPLGMTNLPELSMAFESDNFVYGRTNNPYDLARTPGGSGGGGSAAIAAACSPFEPGGDMGGSIRVPAHFCGIAGLKPTHGRIPLSGYFPGPFGVVMLFSTAGPLARYVEDLALLLRLMAGPDSRDAYVAPAPLPDYRAVDVKSLRVAFHGDNGVCKPSPETEETVRHAARALEPAVARIEEALPPGMDEAYSVWLGLLGADGGAGIRYLAGMAGTEKLTPLVEAALEVLGRMGVSAAEMGALIARRDMFRMNTLRFFQNHDVILCPVSAFPALPHGESVANFPAFSYTVAHNVSGCPGVVVRAGTSRDGLPIGVQVVAAPWREDAALAVAAVIEAELGGYQPPVLSTLAA